MQSYTFRICLDICVVQRLGVQGVKTKVVHDEANFIHYLASNWLCKQQIDYVGEPKTHI